MGENKGGGGSSESTKKQQQQQHLTSSSSPSPKEHHHQHHPLVVVGGVPDTTTDSIHNQYQHSPVVAVSSAPSSFLSPPPPPPPSLYIPTVVGPAASSFDQQQFDLTTGTTSTAAVTSNPKRPRYTATGQWKLLSSQTPSSHSHQKQTTHQLNVATVMSTESTPSPSAPPTNPHSTPSAAAAATSSSDTATSSPSHPSLSGSAASAGQEFTNKPSSDAAGDQQQQQQQHYLQLRKGKYVSPVWKPNEMLWLARAWRVHYQGCGGGSSDQQQHEEGAEAAAAAATPQGKVNKTRAEKDKEVAEFLNRHGVNRDAKTAGTKWDNMLGEFRKVYEWERGGERDQIGKSYFRLSPYERKLHRLPASFDEEVFEELSQFMSSRMRTPRPGGGAPSVSTFISAGSDDSRSPLLSIKPALPPHLTFRDDHDLPLSGARSKQLVLSSGGEGYLHGGVKGSNLLGFDTSSPSVEMKGQLGSKELRRIGKVRMVWEESVNLWAEEGEHHRGRVKLQGSSFLNADELTFLDDSMVACTMETFEDGTPLRGFSVDRFVSGQQVKVFGRRKSTSSAPLPPPLPPQYAPSLSGFHERTQLPSTEPSIRSIPPWEFQDPTEYYVGCLRIPPPTLPSLVELPWHLQEPPPEELRFPLRKDVYRDLPQGKEAFFTTSSELLDCRAITFDILSPIIRSNPSLAAATSTTTRDSFIGLWDDCINRLISKFCSVEMVFIRKPFSPNSSDAIQDQWPNVTAFIRNFCLWRGDETDQLREGHIDPSDTIVDKLAWTYIDLPYVLGYYAVGYIVTFCAFSRTHDSSMVRTDLYTIDLSTPGERLKALIPCWRIAGLLPLLADRCFSCINNVNETNLKLLPYSDFERIDLGNGNILEMTPNTVTRYLTSKRKWVAVKEIYDFLDHRIPHSEFMVRGSEKDLSLTFKPRGCKFKPANCEQLVEALKYVTKALVALHDLSFMHRDLGWDKVMRRSERERENEWFVMGYEEAVGAPQIYPRVAASGRHAPEMMRGLHGVKVDVWGVGQLVKSCGLVGIPKLLRELQSRCLDPNPEQRPTAADCYHHLLQLQSSISSATAPGGGGGGGF